MRLVVDASVIIEACLSKRGLELLAGHELLAPPLLVSEVLSALRGLHWRGEISDELARVARGRLDELAVTFERPVSHLRDAWEVAERLGWAKTYDAEYAALARHHDVPLLTVDRRLARGLVGAVRVMAPDEL